MKSILRWIPATILLLVFILLWGTAVAGGIRGTISYLTLMTGLPFVGGFALLLVLVIAGWKRTFTMPRLVTTLVSLLVIWPYLWQFDILTVAYPSSLETASPVATVRLPANEPILVSGGGDTPQVNHHVILPDQRWAYDLVVEPALSLSHRLEDYGCWGIPVVSPVDGEVVLVQDGEEDQTPGQDSAGFIHPGGNHIAIRLETDTYLFMAHFQKNSIVVHEGDWVTEGQVVGKCGNSGNTFEPHIHIHHQRQDPGTLPVGLAEGLPLYFRDHDGPPMPQGGVRLEDGVIIPLGDRVQHIGK